MQARGGGSGRLSGGRSAGLGGVHGLHAVPAPVQGGLTWHRHAEDIGATAAAYQPAMDRRSCSPRAGPKPARPVPVRAQACVPCEPPRPADRPPTRRRYGIGVRMGGVFVFVKCCWAPQSWASGRC